MLVTDEGMATLANELHPLKASASMMFTDVGIATPLKELHPLKAHGPMLANDVGIVTLVTSSLFTLHSRHESVSESCPQIRPG